MLEADFGPLVPAEILLHFEPHDDREFLERLRVVQEIDDKIRGIGEFGGTLSAATFAPSLESDILVDATLEISTTTTSVVDIAASPRSSADSRVARIPRHEPDASSLAMQQLVDSLRSELKDRNLLFENGNRQTWRISTRVAALADVDYAAALQRPCADRACRRACRAATAQLRRRSPRCS